MEDDRPRSTRDQWRSKYKLLYNVYHWKMAILFVWMGSREEVRMMFKFLYGHQCPAGLFKAQSKNCAMAIVASSIMALIAITSLLLPGVNDVHWLVRAFWIASVSFSLMSASYACKHMTFIGNVLLENRKDPWTLKRWFQCGDCNKRAHPCLRVVLLLSGTKMFFKSAVIAYVIGIGIYFGKFWRKNLNAITKQYTRPEQNPDASAILADSRNIFVAFVVIAVTCYCLYIVLNIPPHPQELKEWELIEAKFNNKDHPFLCNQECFAKTITGNTLPGNGLDRDAKMCYKHQKLSMVGERIYYNSLTELLPPIQKSPTEKPKREVVLVELESTSRP